MRISDVAEAAGWGELQIGISDWPLGPGWTTHTVTNL